MKTEELENLDMEALHSLALEKCEPRFQKRIFGFMTGHRRFLLELLDRCDEREAKRPYPNNVEGEA